jgi:hypothetical protein
MFNTTNFSADNVPGAVARLLCERRGEWFTFRPFNPHQKMDEVTIHTALILRIESGHIDEISGQRYPADRDTIEKLRAILNRHHPATTPEGGA